MTIDNSRRYGSRWLVVSRIVDIIIVIVDNRASISCFGF